MELYTFNYMLQRGIEYNRRNSPDELIAVKARTVPELIEYWRLRASREANNPKSCDCTWCHGERRRGFGNSLKKVLTTQERSIIFQGMADIELATEDHRPINHAWRNLKVPPRR